MQQPVYGNIEHKTWGETANHKEDQSAGLASQQNHLSTVLKLHFTFNYYIQQLCKINAKP